MSYRMLDVVLDNDSQLNSSFFSLSFSNFYLDRRNTFSFVLLDAPILRHRLRIVVGLLAFTHSMYSSNARSDGLAVLASA